MTTTATSIDGDAEWRNDKELQQHEDDEKGVTQQTRIIVYQRDNWRCRKCGEQDTAKLTVHHVIFRSQGGNHRPENLVTVCWKCHMLIHDKIVRVLWRSGDWFFADERHWRSR